MAEKTFFDDVKETADNNKTGLGAGVIGLMLGLLAFDLGPIASLLVGLGAFALGNYLGDGENSVIGGLFKKKDGNVRTNELLAGMSEPQREQYLSESPIVQPLSPEQTHFRSMKNGREADLILHTKIDGDAIAVTKVTKYGDKSGEDLLQSGEFKFKSTEELVTLMKSDAVRIDLSTAAEKNAQRVAILATQPLEITPTIKGEKDSIVIVHGVEKGQEYWAKLDMQLMPDLVNSKPITKLNIERATLVDKDGKAIEGAAPIISENIRVTQIDGFGKVEDMIKTAIGSGALEQAFTAKVKFPEDDKVEDALLTPKITPTVKAPATEAARK
jgi:hypothetical protein